MATQDRDRFEQAERSDRQDLSPLGPVAHKEKISRKKRFTPLLTVGLSAIAGAAVGYLLFSDPPRRQVPSQELASIPSIGEETHDTLDTASTGRAKEPQKEKPDRNRTSFDRVVVAGPARSGTSVSQPATSAPAPAPPSRSKPVKKEPKERIEPQFTWPPTPLYHLYRKRDKLHYYTTSGGTFESYQESEGFKPRLTPGYVYSENHYPRKLRSIHPYGLPEAVFVFMRDQGDETVPLYRLRNFGGNKDMYTSWDQIRQEWLERGWADEGIAGYIYRP